MKNLLKFSRILNFILFSFLSIVNIDSMQEQQNYVIIRGEDNVFEYCIKKNHKNIMEHE